MKITVIGHWGGFPKAGEASSGYLFQHDGFNLLVDCGSAVLSNLQKYIEIESLDALILSHYHHDHIADVGPLQYGVMIKTKLSMTSKTLMIYGHTYDEQAFGKLNLPPYVKAKAYEESQELKVGPFKIVFCETNHPVKCFAMRISDGEKTVVYTADTSYFDKLIEFSKDAELLISECNLYSYQGGAAPGHLTSTEAAKVAREAGVKELLLTHLPHYGDTQDLVRDAGTNYSGKVELARAGWIWGA